MKLPAASWDGGQVVPAEATQTPMMEADVTKRDALAKICIGLVILKVVHPGAMAMH